MKWLRHHRVSLAFLGGAMLIAIALNEFVYWWLA